MHIIRRIFDAIPFITRTCEYGPGVAGWSGWRETNWGFLVCFVGDDGQRLYRW